MSVGIVLLIDESAAMETAAATGGAGGPLPSGPAKSKAESVATAVNALVARLAQAGDCEVALVGYRSTADGQSDVGTRWDGALAGREFVPAAEAAQAPVEVEQRLRRVRSEAGLTEELPVQFPIWYRPRLGEKAPQIAAFEYCRQLLERWMPATGGHGQPLVLHLWSGAAGDGNPLKAVKSLQEATVHGASPLVVHVHLGTAATTMAALFPANRAYLPAGPQRDLFDRSSLLPTHLVESLKAAGVPASGAARGMVYNAKMIDVTRALGLAATHVQRTLEGSASIATPGAALAPKPAAAGPKLGPAIIKPPPAPPKAPVAKPVAVKPPTAVTPPAMPKFVKPPAAPIAAPATPPIASIPAAAAPVAATPVPATPAAPSSNDDDFLLADPALPAAVEPTPSELGPLELATLEPGTDDLLVESSPTGDVYNSVSITDLALNAAPSVAPRISAESPGCLVFVLDRSVADPYAADLANVCSKLLTQLGDMTAEVVKAGKGAVEAAVVTYGDSGGDVDVRTTLEGGLAGKTFARDTELMSGAVRVDEFEDQVSDGVGGLIVIPRKRPVLVEVEPTGAARMQPAFQAVAGLLRQWCANHADASLSPLVVHLTRGNAAPDDVQAAVAELASVTTLGGAPVALYHAVTTETPHASVVYPDSDAALETDSLRALWQGASPVLFGDQLAAEKPTIRPGSRGLVVNGKFFLLVDAFKRALNG